MILERRLLQQRNSKEGRQMSNMLKMLRERGMPERPWGRKLGIWRRPLQMRRRSLKGQRGGKKKSGLRQNRRNGELRGMQGERLRGKEKKREQRRALVREIETGRGIVIEAETAMIDIDDTRRAQAAETQLGLIHGTIPRTRPQR
jgi:hypothetical protein